MPASAKTAGIVPDPSNPSLGIPLPAPAPPRSPVPICSTPTAKTTSYNPAFIEVHASLKAVAPVAQAFFDHMEDERGLVYLTELNRYQRPCSLMVRLPTHEYAQVLEREHRDYQRDPQRLMTPLPTYTDPRSPHPRMRRCSSASVATTSATFSAAPTR